MIGKGIIAIFGVLVLLSTQVMATVDTQSMINGMNTPENVQLVSRAIDNEKLLKDLSLSDDAINALLNNNAFFIEIGSDTYYFTKYNGLGQCDAGCNQAQKFIISPGSVKFVFENQDLAKRILTNGGLDLWTRAELYAKALLYYRP